jgi:Regulator of ribonuclease activity B
MNNTIKILAISLLALTGLAPNPAHAQQRSPDGQSLDQLAKSGSDLTKLHQVDFTLRFPTVKAAERAELQLIGLAFTTMIERGKTANERVVQASKMMFPVESDLMGLRDKLDGIATAGKGVYEGWRAKAIASIPQSN